MSQGRGALALALGLLTACSGGAPAGGHSDARAARRAYDGAPPTIPHERFGSDCLECHGSRAIEVPGVGLSPPSPHASDNAAMGRCEQCHVHRTADDLFAASGFEGLRQDLRRGGRQHALAPPVMPHALALRENCLACHAGPASRPEIRTTHPTRGRCLACHAQAVTDSVFERP